MVRGLNARSLSFLASLALTTGMAQAGITFLRADLTNEAENPDAVPTATPSGSRPASFGTADFVLNDDNPAAPFMTMDVIVFNIDFTGSQTPNEPKDNLTLAHIHAAPTVTPDTNGGVVWGFIGSPFNDTTPNDVLVTPFATGVGGTVHGKWDQPEGNGGTTLSAQISNLLNGHAYINFHTTEFGGGEIRGNIFVVPEPATLGLVGIGAATVLRRRSRA